LQCTAKAQHVFLYTPGVAAAQVEPVQPKGAEKDSEQHRDEQGLGAPLLPLPLPAARGPLLRVAEYERGHRVAVIIVVVSQSEDAARFAGCGRGRYRGLHLAGLNTGVDILGCSSGLRWDLVDFVHLSGLRIFPPIFLSRIEHILKSSYERVLFFSVRKQFS
jgi:hypothetical protein